LADSGGSRSPGSCADLRQQSDDALRRAQDMQQTADNWSRLYQDCSTDDDGMCAMIGNVYAQAAQINADMMSNTVDLNPINDLSAYYCSQERRAVFDARLRSRGAFYCAGTGLIAREIMQRGAAEAFQQAWEYFNMWLTCLRPGSPEPAMSPDPGIGPGGSNPCDLGTALFQRVFGYQTGTHWADVVVCLGRPNPRTFVPTTPGWTYAGCASCCRSHLRDVPPSCVATCISECNRIRYWVENFRYPPR